MRRAALLLFLLVPTAACSDAHSNDAVGTTAATSPSVSSSSAGPSLDASTADPTARRDCLTAGLGFITLKNVLPSGPDAEVLLAVKAAPESNSSSAGVTSQGQAAELALANLNVAVAQAKALATVGQAPDRAGLQSALSAAGTSCQALGAGF